MSSNQATFPILIEVSSECLGTGQCEMIAPELFALDDEDRSRPRRSIEDAMDLERARTAARSCPTQAIEVLFDE